MHKVNRYYFAGGIAKHWVFAGCYNLTAIVLPEGLSSIGKNAFACCKSLTTITVPAYGAVDLKGMVLQRLRLQALLHLVAQRFLTVAVLLLPALLHLVTRRLLQVALPQLKNQLKKQNQGVQSCDSS